MPDTGTAPGEWVKGGAPQPAAGERVESIYRGRDNKGRWPEAEPLCHVHTATVAHGTVATTPSHTWDFHSEEMDNKF